MTTVISVDNIGLCRTGPDNNIDLQAVYGGRISDQKDKGFKVNPLYSDTQTSSSPSPPDINGNMSSLHVVTYETFPRIKDKVLGHHKTKNGHLQNGSLRNTKQNGEVHNVKEGSGDFIIDINRNMLTATKSVDVHNKSSKDPGSENHTTSVSSNSKNIPVLLGPGSAYRETIPNSNHIEYEMQHLSPSVTSQSVTQSLDAAETLKPVYVEESALKSPTRVEIDQGKMVENVENTYRVLGTDDVTVILENNEPDLDHIYATVQKKSNAKSLLGYENKAFNSNGEKEKVDKVRNPLERQNSIDYDSELGYIVPVNGKIDSESLDTVTSGDDQNRCNADQDKKSTACEILTEAIVHTTNHCETQTCNERHGKKFSNEDHVCHSEEMDSNDWPDIDQLVRQDTEFIEENETLQKNCDEKWYSEKWPTRARSVSDTVQSDGDYQVIVPNIKEDDDHCNNDKTSGYKKNRKQNVPKVGGVNDGSTRTLKSILTNNGSISQCSCSQSGTQRVSDSESEIHELKSVKFSKDTVFNENKTGKYKQEKVGRINLREIYRGKIVNDAAMAKMNPLYVEDETKGPDAGENGSLTDDQKLAYQLTLKKAIKMSKGKNDVSNQPSYMEKYLVLKAHGLKPDDGEIEKLPEWIEKPVYDRLIQRTIAKERRKCCVKWTFVILTVLVITAIATVLGIHFKGNF